MQKKFLLFTLFILFISSFEAQPVSAQKKTKKKPIVASKINWSGKWTHPSRFAPNDLEIKMLSGNRFEFVLEAMNGANMGVIDGVATVKGAKAVYDDRTSEDTDSHKQGCVLTFTHRGEYIAVEQTSECSYYAGNAVVFAGKYQKDVMNAVESDFVYLKVFPDKKLDWDFKMLVGSEDYERFLDSFHLIYEVDDLDDLGAKVYSACVRGVCPYNAAIIMYDDAGKLWAAVIYPDDGQEVTINYYSNAPEWQSKMPKTIEEWVKEKKSLNENVTINFKKGGN